MDKHTFISTEKFKFSRWMSTFPDAVILNDLSILEPIDEGSIVWILSQTNHWDEFVASYIKAGFKVIVLTRNQSIDEFKIALQAGARGYVEVLASKSNLKQIAHSVNEGALWLPSGLLARMIGNLSSLIEEKDSSAHVLSLLTHREKTVCNQVLLGATNKEIARELDITERTVKAHLTSIFSKVGAKDRMHLMLLIRGH